MKMRTFILRLVAGLYFSARMAQGQGETDYTFNAPMTDEPIYAVAVDQSSDVWIGGAFSTVGGQSSPSLAVLDATGAISPLYTSNFLSTVANAYVVAITSDAYGRMYVGYRSYWNGNGGVARFLAPANGGYTNWAYDKTFSTNISAKILWVNSLAIDSSGNIYVAGTFSGDLAGAPVASFDYVGYERLGFTQSFSNEMRVYSMTGTYVQQVQNSWHAFPSGGPPGATTPVFLLAGSFGAAEVDDTGAVLNYYAPPQFMASFGFTCAAERTGDLSCETEHGELLAGGMSQPIYIYYSGYNDQAPIGMELARLGALGPVSPTNYFPLISESQNYPADDGASINRIIALPAGDMLVAGQFSSIHGHSVQNFAHLLADGTVDASFPNSTGISVLDVAQQSDGEYLLAGYGYDHNGFVERRYAVPAPSDPTFTPDLADQAVYPGDDVEFFTQVGGWPPSEVQWLKDGRIPTNASWSYYYGDSALYITSVTTNDAGHYQLWATNSFCGPVPSSNALLTVLPIPPPPANDMFSNAVVLTGLAVSGQGTIRSATLEEDEPSVPSQFASGRSVWWTWTAPFSGVARVDPSGSDFSATVGIFVGSSVDDLGRATNNYTYGAQHESGLLPNVCFAVAAGTTYHICVGGTPNSGSLGNVLFTIAPAGSAWTTPNPVTNSSLDAVVAAPGLNVTCGAGGTILTSPDAANWTPAHSGTVQTLRGLAYGAAGFVAVGDTGVVLTSPDGTNWSSQNSGLTSSIGGVAFGNGKYVAVSASDVILTSTDGTNWSQGTTGSGDYLTGLSFAGGQFIVAGEGNALLDSVDGLTWNAAVINTYDYLYYSTAYGNGQFMAVGYYGTVLVSPDGQNWYQSTSGSGLRAVAFGGGRFAVVGSQGLMQDLNGWHELGAGSSQHDQYVECDRRLQRSAVYCRR